MPFVFTSCHRTLVLPKESSLLQIGLHFFVISSLVSIGIFLQLFLCGRCLLEFLQFCCFFYQLLYLFFTETCFKICQFSLPSLPPVLQSVPFPVQRQQPPHVCYPADISAPVSRNNHSLLHHEVPYKYPAV